MTEEKIDNKIKTENKTNITSSLSICLARREVVLSTSTHIDDNNGLELVRRRIDIN